MVSQVPVDTMVINMNRMICLKLKKFLNRVLVKYTNPVKPRMMIDAGPFVKIDKPVEIPATSSHLKEAALFNLFALFIPVQQKNIFVSRAKFRVCVSIHSIDNIKNNPIKVNRFLL